MDEEIEKNQKWKKTHPQGRIWVFTLQDTGTEDRPEGNWWLWGCSCQGYNIPGSQATDSGSLIKTVSWSYCLRTAKRKLSQQVVVQLLRCVWLFVTPWTAAQQASLSITNSWSLFRLMSIESVMLSNHLILCHPLLLLPSIFPSIRVFSNKLIFHIRWPKYWSFSISPSNEYSGLISFRLTDWSPCSLNRWECQKCFPRKFEKVVFKKKGLAMKVKNIWSTCT